jgi:hypothetical protein
MPKAYPSPGRMRASVGTGLSFAAGLLWLRSSVREVDAACSLLESLPVCRTRRSLSTC